MDGYLRKHWPLGSVSVSCRVYASQRRADEHKRLQLSAEGIELRSVGPSASAAVGRGYRTALCGAFSVGA
ncbi:hypothetical protein V7S43_018655 [Phytophthora oleae]|uniref:Uncharacterized protein n=1 Tax=Phytophthora oleae TaxID=2107226 RepID=A0ABD3EQU3_9STRA